MTDTAAGSPGPHVLESWMVAEPGWTMLDLRLEDLVALQGEPDPSRITRYLLGGTERQARLHAQVVLRGPAGSAVGFGPDVPKL